MGPKKPIQDVHAAAFFNGAREYQGAADELFAIADARPKTKIYGTMQFDSPLNLLYFHTIELALKAFLRANNLPILKTRRQSHNLYDLYLECRNLGLTIGPRDKFEIENIVQLLDIANEHQGIRYFNLQPSATADLSWVRKVTAELMRAVEPHVVRRQQQDNLRLDVPAKATVVAEKPVPGRNQFPLERRE